MNIEAGNPVEGKVVEYSLVAPRENDNPTFEGRIVMPETKPTIEQSLDRIHKVRDAYREKMEGEESIRRQIGADVFVFWGNHEFHDFHIGTVSNGSLSESAKSISIGLADGKDLAATLEGLAEVAEQFLEVL